MDHIKLLNHFRSEENINKAFIYALNDRLRNDSYFDYFEIEYVQKYRQQIIEEILEELKYPKYFRVRVAYTYYFPKNNLCYRRMIYLPFKDLVVRYAFIIILANHLDKTLSNKCFANRRATGKQAQNFLFEDYYNASVVNFRNWQKQCAEKYNVLIRTDISSFYDSVSHQYLIKYIENQLSIDSNTEFIQIFLKLLSPKIVSYSNKLKKVQILQNLQQGLTIGNNLEGFLANLYLRDVDEAMQDADIEFGRYNDDMRIFAQDPQLARNYLLILQEHLLSKGLNLNASKTLIAENKEEIERLRTKWFDDPSFPNSDLEDDKSLSEKSELHKYIDRDKDLDNPSSEFNLSQEITKDEDAKNFCQFIQHYLSLPKRKLEHIDKLKIILKYWQGSSKQASWLLVQSTYDQNISDNIKSKAVESVFDILSSSEALSYTKYRLLHHLVKFKKDQYKQPYTILNKLETKRQEKLKKILFNLLEQPAFDLNITALYALRILGASSTELEIYAKKYIPQPLGEPILNAIIYIQEL